MKTVWYLALACAFALTVHAEERFPQPQLPAGHALPEATQPMPRIATMECLDVAVLVAALAMAAFLALKLRSRKGVFILMLFSVAYFGFWRKGCVCAVGSIQNVVAALCDPSAAVPLSILLFFLLPLVFALFFGRVFCAAVCPLGAVQDLVAVAPMRVAGPVAALLGLLPVIYLGLAVLFVAAGAGFLICRYDPFVAFFRLSGEPWILITGAVLLAVGVFVARPYCRFACPYGVLLDVCSRFSKWHATITPDECVKCRLCERACPFDAILTPNAAVQAEARSAGLRRLKLLLVLLPLFAFAGGLALSRLEPYLSHFNPAVALADRVQAGESSEAGTGVNFELEAFRASGRTDADINRDAADARRTMNRASWLIGSLMGLIFGLKLAGLSLRRTREDYVPDKGLCFSCARCYMSCPKERQRLEKK